MSMKMICHSTLLGIGFFSACLLYGGGESGENSSISLEEADIVIYVLPQCVESRNRGIDVQWVSWEPKAGYNTADYYFFEVRAEKATGRGWSGIIGHFGVNKHTADARSIDDPDTPNITGAELSGIQRIIRSARHITPEMVRRRGREPVLKETH